MSTHTPVGLEVGLEVVGLEVGPVGFEVIGWEVVGLGVGPVGLEVVGWDVVGMGVGPVGCEVDGVEVGFDVGCPDVSEDLDGDFEGLRVSSLVGALDVGSEDTVG